MPEEIPEKTRQLLSILRDALQREREALIIYQRAAELCQDEELKNLLKGFCKDEARHENLLIQRYNRLRKTHGDQDK